MRCLTPLFAFLLSTFAYAGAPVRQSPPKGPCDFGANPATIRVALTVEVSDTYRKAVQDAADKQNVKVEFVKLMDNSSVDLANPKKSFDAVISPGGMDILPEYFLTQNPDTPEKQSLRAQMKKEYYDMGFGKTSDWGKMRDSFEYQFHTRYVKDDKYKDIPMLGICYGMQMMGAVQGLPLYVDLTVDLGIPARKGLSDTISQTPGRGTLLNRVIASSDFQGKKGHHQALNYEYWQKHKAEMPQVKITADSNDKKIAEVLELKNRHFLGTQFHPELSEPVMKDKIFGWFVGEACKNVKKNRAPASKAPAPAAQNSTVTQQH